MNQDQIEHLERLQRWMELSGRKLPLRPKEHQTQYLARLKGHRTPEAGEKAAALLPAAEALLKEAFPKGLTHPRREMETLLRREAAASAAIEGEFGEENTARHTESLWRFLKRPLGQDSLLQLHQEMMDGQEHAQPGQYRTLNVHVGLYRAPEYERVNRLMDQWFLFQRRTPEDRLTAAAWGHAKFEAIHPFADGNGRTGRAMIQAVLKAPLPVSEWILERRQQYYRMLGATWEQYFEWFLEGTAETCRRVIQERG